jgi:hypothetical protein
MVSCFFFALLYTFHIRALGILYSKQREE